MSEIVQLEIVEQLATITLANPAKRNALSRQLVTELFAHLDTVAASAARVLVLRSSDRVFCAGADLSEAATVPMETATQALVDLQRRLLTLPIPVVCRLDGPVRAGGLGLVAASDIVLCAADTNFALTEVRLAVAPAVISLTLLPRLTSRGAAETFLSGRKFSATEAAEIGLVTRVVPAAEMDAAVAELCAEICAGYPQGLAATKQLLNKAAVAYLDENAAEMAQLSANLFGSEQARDAMLAFLTKK